MKSEKDASFLAELMVETGERMGKRTIALITDMDQPLGNRIGNALEVIEVIDVLRGAGPTDLRELCLELSGWMLHLGGVSRTVAEGRQRSSELIASGKALEKFGEMIRLQGGDADVVDDAGRLPQSQHTMEVASPKAGHLTSMQCEQIGTACVILGGGRERKEDSVDPAVGIVLHKKVGDSVDAGEPIATIHYNSQARAEQAKRMIEASCEIRNQPPTAKRPLIHKIIEHAVEKN
jgi:pyrimidine-nucleoside phosphorylase